KRARSQPSLAVEDDSTNPTISWVGFVSGEIESPKGVSSTVAVHDGGSLGIDAGLFERPSASILGPAGIGLGLLIGCISGRMPSRRRSRCCPCALSAATNGAPQAAANHGSCTLRKARPRRRDL